MYSAAKDAEEKYHTRDKNCIFCHSFFCGLFTEIFSVSRLCTIGWYDYRWMMSWKGLGRKLSGLIEGLRRSTKKNSQKCGCPGRDLNWEPPVYKSGVLPVDLPVWCICICEHMPPVFTLISCLVCSLTLKMEVTCSSETSVDFQQTAQCYISEDRTLQLRKPPNNTSGYPSRVYGTHFWNHYPQQTRLDAT
jgi:hypothetical protein